MSVRLFDVDTERALLSAVLTDPRRILDVSQVAPADFYDPAHGEIWGAMLALAGQPFDVPMIRAHIVAAGRYGEQVGTRLLAAEDSALSAANVETYAKHVAGYALRRRIAAASERLAEIARERCDDVGSLVDAAEREVMAIAPPRSEGGTVQSPEVVRESLAHLERIRQAGEVSGVTTGLPSLDRRTSGMQPSELWVIGARPGVGKTALATEIVLAAAGSGVGVLLFNLEMQRKELGIRAICAKAGLSLEHARAGRMSDWDMERIKQASAAIWSMPIWWNHEAASTIAGIRSEARRVKQRDPRLGLVVVDYIGLVGSSSEHEARHLEVAAISRGLKQLASELGVTVLALSQVSRDVEKNKRRPGLADLRESGSVEQDANTVLFLHRDAGAEPRGETGAIDTELIVAKQRNGPTGILPITFHARSTSFSDGGWMPEPPAPTDDDAPRVVRFADKHKNRRQG